MVTATYPPKSTKYNVGEGLMGHTTKGNEGKETKRRETVGSEGKTRWERVVWILVERSGLIEKEWGVVTQVLMGQLE